MPRLDEFVGKDPEPTESVPVSNLIPARIVKTTVSKKYFLIFPGYCERCNAWKREVTTNRAGVNKCRECWSGTPSPFGVPGRDIQIGYGEEEEKETTPELGVNSRATIQSVRDEYIRKGKPWCHASTDEEAISEIVSQYSLNAPLPGWDGIDNRNAVSKFYYGDLEGLNPN